MGQQDILETRNASIRDEIKKLIDTADGENRGISDDEQTQIDGLHAEVRSNLTKIDSIRATAAEQAEFEARTKAVVPLTPPVNVPVLAQPTGVGYTELREEPYRQGGRESWFLDRYMADKGDRQARERLDVAYRYRVAHPEMETRAGATTVAGAGGELAPPAWYENQLVGLLRPGRVFADALNKQPLPPDVSSINLPKIATGTAVASQTTQNTQIAQQDITTTSVSTGITTVAGGALVSLQLLQQSPISIDQVILEDLAKALATQVDIAAINAVANVTGINAVTFTGTPSSLAITQFIQQGIDLIGQGLYNEADTIVMRPERWGKMIAANDAASRPFVLPNQSYGPQNNVGAAQGQTAQGYAGTMRGLPVWIDPNIPANLGTGTNQDEIFVLSAKQIYLYESQVFFGTFEQTYANSLSLYIRAHEFLGIIPNRYPRAISVVSGTGMATSLAYGS